MNDVATNDEKSSVVQAKKASIDRTPALTGKMQVKLDKLIAKSSKKRIEQVSSKKSKKAKKPKMVQVSIAIPKPELAVLQEIKLRATKLGTPIKRKALIRASIASLASLSDSALMQVIQLASIRKSMAS